jgi:hypothetical protein
MLSLRRYQENTGRRKCIFLLLLIIFGLILVLIFKPKRHVTTSPPPPPPVVTDSLHLRNIDIRRLPMQYPPPRPPDLNPVFDVWEPWDGGRGLGFVG